MPQSRAAGLRGELAPRGFIEKRLGYLTGAPRETLVASAILGIAPPVPLVRELVRLAGTETADVDAEIADARAAALGASRRRALHAAVAYAP